jgi:hypothetical protein
LLFPLNHILCFSLLKYSWYHSDENDMIDMKT